MPFFAVRVRVALAALLFVTAGVALPPSVAGADPVQPPGILLLGTGADGMFSSRDGGQTWQPANLGLPPGGIWQVQADPTMPNVAYATTGSLFRTDDGGTKWQQIPGIAPGGPGITALATQGALVLAGGPDGVLAGGGRRPWARERLTIPGGAPRRLLAAGQDLLYAVDASGRLYLHQAPWVQSPDWQTLAIGPQSAPITALAYVPQSAQPGNACLLGREGCIELYAAVAGHGLWQSIDSGQHWAQETSEHDALPPTCTILALLPSQDDPLTAYAAVAGQGLYRSHSAGQFWKMAEGNQPHGLIITAMVQVGQTIVAATEGQGVQIYEATNKTFAWRGAASGLPAGVLGLSMAWLPAPVPSHRPPLTLPGRCAMVERTSPYLVCGPFLQFFQHAVQPPTAIFGGVISPLEYDLSDPNLVVQYFARARFEYRADLPGSVRLTPLGSLLTAGRTFPKSPVVDVPGYALYPHTRFFPQTGYSAGGFFLKFWYQHGAARILGYPISSVIFERNGDGSDRLYAMQYFQNARLEYHPERINTHFTISLGLLGQQYYQCLHTGANCHD